uniref:G protein-coupled receptor n=1 Tax=Steinernema glaseri TaxID=37863 RepID=A0A1I7Z2G8_9BILA
MSDSLSVFFNLALNITAAGSIITKSTALYFVVRYTPKKMRHFSHFILDEMGWNFAGNLLYTVAHPVPMMPATCYRMDGFLGRMLPGENAGVIVMTLIILTAVNCAIGIFLSFQFRYMSIAFGYRLAKIKYRWGYLYCAVIHLALSLPGIYFIPRSAITVSEYPDKSLILQPQRMFCFEPHGSKIMSTLGWMFGIFFLTIFLLILFTILSYRHLRLNVLFIESETATFHRALLSSLIILSSIPVLFGCVPLLVAVFAFGMPSLKYAREIVVFCILFALNHGTIYGVTTLLIFKAYRLQIRILVVKIVSVIIGVRNQQQLSKLLSYCRGAAVASSS